MNSYLQDILGNLLGEEEACAAETPDDELDEHNVTTNLDGGLGQPKTPFAFQNKPASDKDKDKEEDNMESQGYGKPVKKTNLYFKKMQEMQERLNGVLSEVSYKQYKSEPGSTAHQKINKSIQEINRMMFEVERMLNHSAKLKQEAGADQTVFWKSTQTRFSKISERLLRINNKVRELSK
jgi:uncharacterized protein YoxC